MPRAAASSPKNAVSQNPLISTRRWLALGRSGCVAPARERSAIPILGALLQSQWQAPCRPAFQQASVAAQALPAACIGARAVWAADVPGPIGPACSRGRGPHGRRRRWSPARHRERRWPRNTPSCGLRRRGAAAFRTPTRAAPPERHSAPRERPSTAAPAPPRTPLRPTSPRRSGHRPAGPATPAPAETRRPKGP